MAPSIFRPRQPSETAVKTKQPASAPGLAKSSETLNAARIRSSAKCALENVFCPAPPILADQREGFTRRALCHLLFRSAIQTVAGHFPLTLVSGAGAAARNSIGITIVAGMALGTLFTLLVIPSIYVLIAKQHVGEDQGAMTDDFALAAPEAELPQTVETSGK
jgi:hypothetical protein